MMAQSIRVAIIYSGAALIAMAINLLTQRAVLLFLTNDAGLILAMVAGTATGFAVKYVLDRHFIFFHTTESLPVEMRILARYAVSAVFTTLMFWLSEYLFWVIWQTHLMRELGAIIGLVSGYVIKYNLDKHFVFATRSNETGSK